MITYNSTNVLYGQELHSNKYNSYEYMVITFRYPSTKIVVHKTIENVHYRNVVFGFSPNKTY